MKIKSRFYINRNLLKTAKKARAVEEDFAMNLNSLLSVSRAEKFPGDRFAKSVSN